MRFTAKTRGCLNVKFHPRLRDGSDLRSRDYQIFSINSISIKGNVGSSRERELRYWPYKLVFNNVGKRRDGKQGQVSEKKGLKIVLFLKPFYLLVAFEFPYYSSPQIYPVQPLDFSCSPCFERYLRRYSFIFCFFCLVRNKTKLIWILTFLYWSFSLFWQTKVQNLKVKFDCFFSKDYSFSSSLCILPCSSWTLPPPWVYTSALI